MANRGLDPVTMGPSRKAAKAKTVKDQCNSNVVLGTQHVETLIDTDQDGGLSYLWRLFNADKNSRPPVNDRAAMVYWACAESPVTIRALELVASAETRGERILLMVNNPWAQR